MTPIKLNNGEEIILVEVPEDSRQHYVTLDGRSVLYKTDNSELEIINLKQPVTGLGIYHKGEIDFEVVESYWDREKDGWVYNKWVERYGNCYKDYTAKQGGLAAHSLSYKESFMSLLKSLTSPNKKYVVLIEIKK